MTRKIATPTQVYPKALLIGIWAPYNRTKNIDSYYQEFLSLAKTNGMSENITHFTKLRTIDPSYFLTKGKRFDIKQICEEQDIEHIIISETLTTTQCRNLQDFFDCKVFDRTDLILDIFEKAAHSAEGKTQVAIARLRHKKTRLAGKGMGMAQQSGAIGVRGGFGETAKEKETRFIEENILQLKKQLKKIQNVRDIQRKRRLETQVPHICLVGYTNAGKSTLLNVLTKSNVLAEDKLFATLDTTTRELFIGKEKIGIISDTVGFIQQLPPRLIEAFKSTLSELQYADLLLHVIDISDPNWESHIRVVNNILKDIGVEKDMLYLFNKGDLLDEDEANSLQFTNHLAQYQPYVLISATTKEKNGIRPLIDYLRHWKK